MISLTSHSLSENTVIASKIIDFNVNARIFAFFGEMGVGKTTLINEIVAQLGVEEKGSSPTFSIVNEYFSSTFQTVYHFDFYRINELEEALDIGFDEYIDSGFYCFIEWPEKIENLLPLNYVRIEIVEDNQERKITIQQI